MTDDNRTVDGYEFAFAQDGIDTVPLWGRDGDVLWARGEGLMLVAPEGCGKTTVGQQLMLARAGILPTTLLGFPVERAQGRQLYIAADRPVQAAKSMRRMVNATDEAMLRAGIIVHRGPLPFDPTLTAKSLREFAEAHDATTVYIDSLKDIAVGLSKDDIGAAVNIAHQEITAAGIELVVLHHQRKPQPGTSAPKQLADVYGSRWLTAGMGSVVCLWGEPGDSIVALTHLKQPEETVGPFNILHDHVHGRSTVHDHTDLEDLIATTRRSGLTVKDAARHLFDKPEPKPNDIEKARRKLERLVATNRVEKLADAEGVTRYRENNRVTPVTPNVTPSRAHETPHGLAQPSHTNGVTALTLDEGSRGPLSKKGQREAQSDHDTDRLHELQAAAATHGEGPAEAVSELEAVLPT